MINPINPIKQKTKIHAEQMGLTDLANKVNELVKRFNSALDQQSWGECKCQCHRNVALPTECVHCKARGEVSVPGGGSSHPYLCGSCGSYHEYGETCPKYKTTKECGEADYSTNKGIRFVGKPEVIDNPPEQEEDWKINLCVELDRIHSEEGRGAEITYLLKYIENNFVSKQKIKQEAESLLYPCKACKHSSCQMIRKLLKSLGLDL